MNKKKVMYSDAPKSISKEIAEGEIIFDFLPPPEKLIRRDPKIKITIALNSGSVDFLKNLQKRTI